MNIRNFSLDYIQPTAAPNDAPKADPDPWTNAVNYYGPFILETLQESGNKGVQELYDKARVALKVPSLQLDQFALVIDRMVGNHQLIVKDKGQSPGEAVVALPVRIP